MLAVWLAQISRALCAPVELPADVDVAAWRTALLLSDLEAAVPGSIGDAPGVRMTSRGDLLQIWARDIHGAEHTLTVPMPKTAREREAAAALAASLVQPMRSPTIELPAPPLPAPARPSPPAPVPRARTVVVSAPAPALVEAPSVEARPIEAPSVEAPHDENLSVEPSTEVSQPVDLAALDRTTDKSDAIAALELVSEPIVERMAPPVVLSQPPDVLLLSQQEGWLVVFGPSLRMRPDIRSMVALGAQVGRFWGPWGLAGGVEFVAPARILEIDNDRRLSALDVRAMPSWRAGSWEIGASLGASGRYASDEDRPPPPALLPTVGLSLAYTAQIADLVALRPSVRAEMDLIPSGVGYDGAALIPLSPFSLGIGLGGVLGRR